MQELAYYNEFDKPTAEWLRNLIAAGHIAPGHVDDRSIEDVKPSDLAGYAQHHFFAGIGVWSLALRRAGWPDNRRVWTASCPCQPFSAAGQGAGVADKRHLWPHLFHLINQCQPGTVLGEQVASRDAEPWLDLVQTDVEGMGYAFGAVAFPASSLGAPHIRDRTYWVAHAERARVWREPGGQHCEEEDTRHRQHLHDSLPGGDLSQLGDTLSTGLALCQRVAGVPGQPCGTESGQTAERAGVHAGRMADPKHDGRGGQGNDPTEPNGDRENLGVFDRGHPAPQEQPPTGPINGHWRDADWLHCRDGRWRPVEPGTFPLAHGSPARVVRLRAYGNSIVAPQARAFIEAVKDSV